MYNWEKSLRDDRYRHEKRNPSFSSTLLDKIYRSIDGGGEDRDDESREKTMAKKQSRVISKTSRAVEEEEMLTLRQACLLEKWMERKVNEKVSAHDDRHQFWSELDKKSKLDYDCYYDHDALFFSSGSNSSESSSGGLSSSDDMDSFYGAKSRPKPIKTAPAPSPERKGRTESTLFHEQSELHHHFNSASNRETQKLNVDGLIKSKSRALKIYGNLKNLKQPISPGGRLASFLNSIFAAGNGRKSQNPSSAGVQRLSKSAQQSTCSSASSFSRSCLSKHSPASREKLRNEVKRSVRFCPVSVIVDEDLRPCGQKSLEGSNSKTNPMSVWKIGKSPAESSDFLKQYQRSARDGYDDINGQNDDDRSSCSSSDLFELDHIALMGRERYREELPVYETTRLDRNRPIANGSLM